MHPSDREVPTYLPSQQDPSDLIIRYPFTVEYAESDWLAGWLAGWLAKSRKADLEVGSETLSRWTRGGDDVEMDPGGDDVESLRLHILDSVSVNQSVSQATVDGDLEVEDKREREGREGRVGVYKNIGLRFA